MATEYLFSYGTLQMEKVQMELFGRTLQGKADNLTCYKLETIEIKDPAVLEKSGKSTHLIAIHTGNKNDLIPGVILELTKDELLRADSYETADYKRVVGEFQSGRNAWVYVASGFRDE